MDRLEKNYLEHQKTSVSDNTELFETLSENQIVDILSNLPWIEEKETPMYLVLTEQWEVNDKLFIALDNTKLKLIKDWVESEITLDKRSIIWESTFLKFLENEEQLANAFILIKWKYLQISFSKLKQELDKLDDEVRNQIIYYFKELENKRKWKTEQVH